MKYSQKILLPKLLFFILAVIIFFVVIIFLISSRIKPLQQQKTFYKCSDKHNPAMEHILDTDNYTRQLTNHPENPNLYMPCTYNNVELELYNIPSDQVANSKIFAIPGCDILASKDTLWHQLEKTYTRMHASRIMPETYITASASDMNLFVSNYTHGTTYILKKNIQRKRGIIILNNLADILNTVHRDPRYVIIQHYISNPFLINNRKLNIRLYVAVVCKPDTKPKGYLHPLGKCIYTNQDYQSNDITNLERHLTSLNLDVGIYSSLPYNLQQLEKLLTTQKYSTVWDKIVKKLGMVMQAVKAGICQDVKGKVNFQLFGVDVMLDDMLEPWILEFNKGPDMTYKMAMDKEIKEKVYEDLFAMIDDDVNSRRWIELLLHK